MVSTEPICILHVKSSSTDNPLLVRRFPIQFDAVKAEHVEPAIELLLEEMRRRLAELGSAKRYAEPTRTF